LRQRLVVLPRQHHGDQWRISRGVEVLDATPKRVRAATDDFGNHVVEIEVPYVAEQVTFISWSVVERNSGGPHLVANDLLNDPRLLAPSKLTAPDEALDELIVKLRSSGLQEAELATAACKEIFELMSYEHGVTTVRTTASEAFAQRRGVCQDYAHVLLAVTRGLGLPSRYVSGQLLGTGGSHAWVEVLVPDVSGRARVLALDPTTGRGAGMTYVTIAVGRDYADIAPVSGTYVAPHSGVLTMSKRAVVRRVEGSPDTPMDSALSA
jgi:transglutaminase-like putative cysteine protease